ncbi:MAG: DUF434 domain-containing protein, partial [Verrucomicrobiota bacterium]
AVSDLSWLFTRGYGEKSSGAIVGDRYALNGRQRIAARRCSCSEEALQRRLDHQVTAGQLAGAPLWIDGYNVLVTIEAALSRGVILVGRDGCYRDLASMHGNFKRVMETPAAIALIGKTLARLRVEKAVWFLDQPVSNSGLLKQLFLQIAVAHQWNWTVELVPDPDTILAGAGEIIASADSAVLDRCARWFNLAREVVNEHVQDAWITDLGRVE